MRTAVAVIGGTLAVALVPTPALAEAGSAPSCVSFKVNRWTGGIKVHNGCNSGQRVKIVVQNWPDSPCKQLSPGEDWTWHSPLVNVDRLETC
jgi:alpha amylase inhibitor